MFTMEHYVSREPDGTVHVQNAVGPYLGQHHVHTPEDFERWMEGRPDLGIGPVDPTNLHDVQAGPCQCGLKAGEMRDGR